MALPDSLTTGLKEWDVVCSALLRGRQILLLRKGGIYESGGEFEIETPRFVLFPTFLHQNAIVLKEEERGGLVKVLAEPDRVQLRAAAEVTDIFQLKSRAQMDGLDAEHIWSPSLIDMRFSYRPENPLYLMLVRAYRLPEAVSIENTPAYAGCKSWVPLEKAVFTNGAAPVLSDGDYASRVERIQRLLGG